MRGFLALLAISLFALLWPPHQGAAAPVDMGAMASHAMQDCADCMDMDAGVGGCDHGVICGAGVILADAISTPRPQGIAIALPIWRGVSLVGFGAAPGVPPPKPVFFA